MRCLVGLVMLLLLLAPQEVAAGDKMKLLIQRAKSLKGKTLIVPEILPDTFYLNKVRKSKKKGAEREATYLRQIAQANINLKRYLQEHFDYTTLEFVSTDVGSYPQLFEGYDPQKYAVLQFGEATQWVTGKKRGKYYTQTFGCYDTDGIQPLVIIPARAFQFHDANTAELTIIRLNEMLWRYYKRGKKEKES
ncbi:MAG: hypothetical protein AAGI38_15705 [Bacteroidota bacterium]